MYKFLNCFIVEVAACLGNGGVCCMSGGFSLLVRWSFSLLGISGVVPNELKDQRSNKLIA
jgi:hypothetical protein